MYWRAHSDFASQPNTEDTQWKMDDTQGPRAANSPIIPYCLFTIRKPLDSGFQCPCFVQLQLKSNEGIHMRGA